jgi:hypothetical protein
MAVKHKVLRKTSATTSCGMTRNENSVTRWEEVTCKKCLKARVKKKQGPPTKWREEYLPIVFNLKSKFYTDYEIAKELGVPHSTFFTWIANRQDLSTCLKEAEANALKTAERALFEKATGYEHDEEKVFSYQGQIITHNTKKKYAPDVQALQYLLNNLDPERWKNKHDGDEISRTGDVTIRIGGEDV